MTTKHTASSRSVPAPRRQELLLRTLAIYRQAWAGEPGPRDWLTQMGIADCALMERYQIGYSSGRLRGILPAQGDVWDELAGIGVMGPDGREVLAGCVVLPVFGPEQELVTLCGIRMDHARPVRETPLPGSEPCVWNIGAAKSHAELFVVDNLVDALSMVMAGCGNVVTPLATDRLPAPAAAFLAEYGVRQLLFLAAGPASTPLAGLPKPQRESVLLQTATLPDGLSPSGFLRARGPRALASAIAGLDAKPTAARESTRRGVARKGIAGIEPCADDGFRVTYGARRYQVMGLREATGQLRATVRVEQGGRLHIDTLDLYRARARGAFCQEAACLLDQPLAQIRADVVRLIRTAEEHKPPAQAGPTQSPGRTMVPEDQREAEEFGRAPDLVERILADYDACGIVGERNNKLLCYLAAVSRKLPEPLSVLIISSSGAGKSALQDATLAFCPPEDVVKLTSLTGKALYYRDEFSLRHKVLALEEEAGAQDAAYAVRSLISSGELTIESTMRDPATGRLRAMANRVQGPTAVFCTATGPEVSTENRSRFVVIGIDESREQTRRILAMQRRRRGPGAGVASERTIARHRNFQRLLRPVAVVNAFAPSLAFGDYRLQARRDQPKYLSLIDAVAVLRQMSKSVHEPAADTSRGHPWVEVDLTDIEIATELVNETMGTSLGELSLPSRNLLRLLQDMLTARRPRRSVHHLPDETLTFTRREVREFTGWSTWRIHTYLQELVECEYVLRVSGRHGCRHRYELAYDGAEKDGGVFFLGLKSVGELTGRQGA